MLTQYINCNACGVARQGQASPGKVPRLPTGWKRLSEDSVFCKACWSARYILRSVTFPVAGPVEDSWAEFRQVLRTVWSGGTELSNWTITELAKADVVRSADMTRLPPAPRIDLYGKARQWNRNLDPGSVNALIRKVESAYRRSRLEVIWQGTASLARFRYPVPYPVHNQSWHPLSGPNHEPMISLLIGRKRRILRLRGGHDYRRQLDAFEQLLAGRAVRGELSVYRQRANFSDHRSGIPARERSEGSNKVAYRVMAKLAAWLPRPVEVTEGTAVLHLRTDADSFWIAELEGSSRSWTLNADQVKRWTVANDRCQRRLQQDRALERAWPVGGHRLRPQPAKNRSQKFHRRINSFCHEATARVSKFASQHKVARVVYSDSCRDFVRHFPWLRLQTLLQEKLDEHGIGFELGRVDQGQAEGSMTVIHWPGSQVEPYPELATSKPSLSKDGYLSSSVPLKER